MSHRRKLWGSFFIATALTTTTVLPAGAAFAAATSSKASYVSDPASLVDPLVATTNGGDDFPGADMPFGMVQWSPDTPSRPSGGGYEYSDNAVTGYSLTHISGPGCSAAGDIPILPTTGAVAANPTVTTEPLSHAAEQATPGYYALTAGGVKTELSTTTHAGIARFTFPQGTASNLLFKLSDSAAGSSGTHVQIVNDHEISGWVTSGSFCGASNTYTAYFDMVFNQPFTANGAWNNSGVRAGATSMTVDGAVPARARAAKATAARARTAAMAQPPVSNADGAYVTFDTSTAPVVTAKVGLSYVSDANAVANRSAEIPGFNFATVRTAAHTAWNAELNKIQIGGGTAAQQATFYTALYHSLLHPNTFSDVNGQYAGFDGQVHTAPAGHAEYANFSGWDIYRDQVQLAAVVDPSATSDIVTSMLNQYNQTGMFPKWAENNGESYVMVGDPADPIIADAYAFGATGFDTAAALTDMQTEANTPNSVRPGLSTYESKGYLPVDGTYGCCNFYGPVSTQLEYNTADNAIAQFANALGRHAVAAPFALRAQNWQSSFNPGTGFMQPKLANGQFQSGFDPTSSAGFVEANSYVYSEMVPFDLEGLIAADGGNAAWVAKLDGLMSNIAHPGATNVQMGNEPSFEIPWEYDYAGAPYRTQATVRQTQDAIYSDTPAGLAGNDDLGAMSSWYVWSAIGAYPETPGSATVALGSPLFPEVAIHLASGKTLTETAPQAADNAPYVSNLTLGGRSWEHAYLPATVWTRGGALNWTLSSTPDTAWAAAAADAPPSSTSGLRTALGYLSGGGNTVVAPGATATLSIGAQNMLASAQAVSWTASAATGSGLTLGPTSGTFDLRAHAKGAQLLSVTAPAGAADGRYLVTISYRSATGVALPDVVAEVDVAKPGDVFPFYNNIGISSDGTPNGADFDGDGYSYSAQALAAQGLTPGGTKTVNGLAYTWPNVPSAQQDNIQAAGQTIPVAAGAPATKIGVIGSATQGNTQTNVVVHYTDGTSQTVTLGLSDWTLGAGTTKPAFGNTVVAATPYRDTTTGTNQTVTTYIFEADAALSGGKPVASVTLQAPPAGGGFHVFALGLR